ncbi:hypothetical protein QFZ49_005939 [Streptomyces turgidiscabies]|uniref:Uncharacterized protein n=1 Tax=Streptomyces turgidiscabies TaxID=85558 RepID=A0ABU0RVE6_9ACTN|nr:hypothetical protein [Streptomyces turgidiscabies]
MCTPTGVFPESLARLERELGTEMIDDPVSSGLGDTEERSELAERQIRAPVGRDQQHPIL